MRIETRLNQVLFLRVVSGLLDVNCCSARNTKKDRILNPKTLNPKP